MNNKATSSGGRGGGTTTTASSSSSSQQNQQNQQPEIHQARNYVARVKSSLGETSTEYELFLSTLKSYRTRQLSPLEVISRISNLFRNCNGEECSELILGFNAFLPAEYQISEEGLRWQQQVDRVRVPVEEEEEEAIVIDDGDDGDGGEHATTSAAIQKKKKPQPTTKMPKSRKRLRNVKVSTVSASSSAAAVSSASASSSKNKKKKKKGDSHGNTSTTSSLASKNNIKVTSYASVRNNNNNNNNNNKQSLKSKLSSSSPPSRSRLVINTDSSDGDKKLNVNTTRIILSSPQITSKDLLFPHSHNSSSSSSSSSTLLSPTKPIISSIHNTLPSSSSPSNSNTTLQQQSSDLTVDCTLCNGKRFSDNNNNNNNVMNNNEPVLLCEQKGCNAEYHLGCLYLHCDNLNKKKGEEEENNEEVDRDGNDEDGGGDGEGEKNGVDTNNDNGNAIAAATTTNDDDDKICKQDDIPSQQQQQQQQQQQEYIIPSGSIYCKSCYEQGATSVLIKYFDKVDTDRSYYTCNRAYVMSLLEKHMNFNTDGNLVLNDTATNNNKDEDGDGSSTVKKLKPPPKSELWYVDELNAQALGIENKEEGEKQEGEKQEDDNVKEEMEKRKEDNTNNSNNNNDNKKGGGSEFLVGKSIRLYNNLDNEYHVGRIVDWRTCTVYPPLYDNNNNNDGPHVSKNNTVQMNELEYYGIGPLSTTEFLVRFPAGLQGRTKELLRWIMLEEHCCAVGVSLIQGKITKFKTGGAGGGCTNVGEWKPGVILARSALELVTVRSFLHEDEDGNLFATMTKGEGKGKSSSSGDRWALASFFGEEELHLLHLRDEARDLMEYPALVGDSKKNGGKEEGDDVTHRATGKEDDGTQPLRRDALATVDVPLSLALAEYSEQERCKEWSKLILQQSNHCHSLVSSDEYSTQLTLENESSISSASNGSTEGLDTNGNKAKPTEGENNVANNDSIRPLIERGMDRLWLAQLVENVSSSSSTDVPLFSKMSKDTVMSFKWESVTSVAGAMASLQHG